MRIGWGNEINYPPQPILYKKHIFFQVTLKSSVSIYRPGFNSSGKDKRI